MAETTKKWDWEIGPNPAPSFTLIKSIYNYRHFLTALVRKEFLLNYQQTILGPVWIFFQPVLTLIVYVLVFGRLIGVPTGKTIPPVLFYFSGIILWNFFSEVLWSISNTFRDHIHLYSKVYFPRIIVPLSVLVTNFLRFLIQFALLVLLIVYYIIFENFSFGLDEMVLALPVILIGVAALGAGCGLIAALLSARYRDVTNLIAIILRLLMFVTPVLYPLAAVPGQLEWIILVNPLTALFEWFRLAILGEGDVYTNSIIYSFSLGLVLLLVSTIFFNAKSNKLIDVS